MSPTASIASPAAPSSAPAGGLLIGRSFINPWFDVLLIGGGLSLIVGAILTGFGIASDPRVTALVPLVILLSNSSHFAASTVRLYTKPGAFAALPFLTMAFPLVTLLVLTLGLLFADKAGRHLNALYLTWSPFHYAAQAYGLSVMYCYRSGCNLNLADKRMVRAVCLLPFFWAFMSGTSNSGLGWFVPPETVAEYPSLQWSVAALKQLLILLTFITPILLYVRLRYQSRTTMPLISMLIILTNGIWWIVFTYPDAFVWVTVFHGIQYLAIVAIFHVKDHTNLPGNKQGWLHHTIKFYVMCLALGYALFNIMPHAFNMAGFGWYESVLLVAAVINIHHFIVDGYIWKLRKDPNYRVVTEGAAV